MPAFANELRTGLAQKQTLAPQLRHSVEMLAMNLPELRAELQREMSSNPVIEDIESTLDGTPASDKIREQEKEDRREESDYPDDDEVPRVYTADADAADRRQRFFDSQTVEETLEEHLLGQLGVSDIEEKDWALAEILIGELNDDGLFVGSIPDIMMVSGESEAKIREVMHRVSQLDPLGCCTASLRDCLLAQMDKLEGSPYREQIEKLISDHLDDIASGRLAAVEKSLGIGHERYADLLRTLQTALDPRPGRAFHRSGHRDEYINPEVHAVKGEHGYIAKVDARSLPEIRISKRYLEMAASPTTDPETRAYVKERIAAAEALRDAVSRRHETVTNIAQAIFDAQPGFFTDGLKGLKPLTMQEIAEKVGVHHATVSRTVNDKYASTPKGTVELRKFFTSGYVTADGVQVSRDNVIERIRAIIAGEDKAHPYSDERISQLLKEEGLNVARRTVASYRVKYAIPGASERRA